MVDLLAEPKFKQFVEQMNIISQQCENLTLPEQRKLATQFHLSHATFEAVNRIEDIEISRMDQNRIALSLYIPNESINLPVLIYFHGGVWVFGSIAEADPVCRQLTNTLGYLVILGRLSFVARVCFS